MRTESAQQTDPNGMFSTGSLIRDAHVLCLVSNTAKIVQLSSETNGMFSTGSLIRDAHVLCLVSNTAKIVQLSSETVCSNQLLAGD
jgi:hypothetical protein